MLLIFMVTVFSIGVEIKDRTAREWLRLSNNSIYIALAGKLLPQTVVFFIMGIFYNVYLYGYLHFPCNSGILPMLLATLPGIGIAMLRYPDDRHTAYPSPRSELRFVMGSHFFLHFRLLFSGDGHESGIAGTQ